MGRKRSRGAKANVQRPPDTGAQILQRTQAFEARGEINQAAKFLRKYLDRTPSDAGAWHRLGAYYHALGKLSAAIDALEMAAELISDDPAVLADLGGLYATAERHTEAVHVLQKAVDQDDESPGAWYNLGNALFSLGKVSDAISCLGRVTKRHPEFADAHYNLGIAQLSAGNFAESIRSLERARTLRPNDPVIQLALARTFRDMKSHRKAVPLYAACVHTKADPALILEYAHTLYDAGEPQTALALLRDGVAKFPHADELQVGLGQTLLAIGETDAAEQALRTALKIDSGNTVATILLPRIRKVTDAGDACVRWLENAIAEPAKSDYIRAAQHFSLGKTYDDLGLYAQAFEHYAAGNSLRAQQSSFNLEEEQLYCRKAVATFSRDSIATLKRLGNASLVPVLIIGMPRSGTTLIEQIIDRHSRGAGAGELQFFPSLSGQLARMVHSDLPFPECIADVNEGIISQITRNYLELLGRHGPSALRVTDKLPGNYRILGLFHALFPQGKIIHCRRNPVDTALSIYFQFFEDGHDYSWCLDDIAAMYRLYESLMQHWYEVMPGVIFDVDYTDVVTNLESVAQALIATLGLDWEEDCLGFHKSGRDIRTASTWQVRQPIYTTSLDRWRHYEAYLPESVLALADFSNGNQ